MYGLLDQATHQKLGWLDNPKNIGLLSAALGILANNKGNYGALGPALGAGGLLGVQSAMQTQQQNILNRRNESRDARSDYFNREQLDLLKKEFGLKQEDSGLFRQSEYGQPSQVQQVAAAAPAITNPVQQPYSEAGFQSQLASTGQATAPQVDVNASKLPSQMEEYRRMAETAYARAQRNAPFGSNKKVKAMIDADMAAAKNYADKADKLEFKLEQGTIGGIPGVTFNKTDGKFYENGSPITAQRVQELANKHAEAGATRLQQNVNAYAPASEEAQKDFIKSTRATYDQLKHAPSLLNNIEAAKALIPGAKGFMGTGGETLLEATKFLNNRLGMNINTEGVKDAEELRSRIFFNIMDNLKKMDAQPSQQQQQVMQESLGKLGTDPNALPGVLDAFADVIRDKVDLHNTEVGNAIARGVKFPYDPTVKLQSRATKIRRYNPATGKIE